ncbi:NADP-dependent oxidoreductase [Microbacterium sp. DT81.1]|uniref:NADP-dependent oxidoreductase n=1 Tax=Microbacterium sp. DT81.1 TaxID=3393413 RepID=UPI003CF0DFD2
MKMPSQTTVFEYDTYGDAGVLQARKRDLPAPQSREVTVEVISSALNHIDGFIRDGREEEWTEEWPRRSGSDFAGVVIARGDEVTRFPVGSSVIGHVSSGAHATFLNVDHGVLVLKPREVSWEVAGGLYLAGATALATLDQLRIGAGDTVVISAAAGAVGSIEAQVAKYRGARVIGTCGVRNFDYLRQIGITPIQYGEGIAERIRRVAGGPVTAMIDNFGKDGRDLAIELGVPMQRYRSSADRRDLELQLLGDDLESVAAGTDLLRRASELARVRAFTLLASGVYPLTDIVEAYADLARLHARGKVVVATHPVSTFRTLKARDVHEAS